MASRRFTPITAASRRHDQPDDMRALRQVIELPSILDPQQCDAALDYIDEFGQSAVELGRGDEVADIRRVKVTSVPHGPTTAWLFETVGRAIDECNRRFFRFDLSDFSDDLNIVDYRRGDFFQWHLDLGPGTTAPATFRKLSVSVALSSPEDYEGGALAFPDTEIDRIPRGDGAIFPSFLLHGVRPVQAGRRCALLAWAGGPQFR